MRERIIQLVGEENLKFMDILTGNAPVETKNNRFSCWINKGIDAYCKHSIIEIDFIKSILYVGFVKISTINIILKMEVRQKTKVITFT